MSTSDDRGCGADGGRRGAAVEPLDQLAGGITGLGQFHRREMAERIAVIAAAGVIAELPGAALGADAQDQAGRRRRTIRQARDVGIERAVSFFVGMSGSGFGCNLGAASPLYPGTLWDTKK